MKQYAKNSPEAMARLVALMMVSDGEVDPREMSALDQMNAWPLLGLSRQGFLHVARDYCADLKVAADAQDGVSLLDEVATEAIVGSVDDPDKRRIVGQLMLAVLDADRRHAAEELIVYSSIMKSWGQAGGALQRLSAVTNL